MSTEDSYEDRLGKLEHRAFSDAVIAATEQATQNVAQVHRRRLVLHSAISTAVVMAAIGLTITLFVARNNNRQAVTDARRNCVLFLRVATDIGQFISTDAHLRELQQLDTKRIAELRPGALKALFTDPQTVSLSKLSRLADTQTTHFWRTWLVPDLQRLAGVNCTKR